MIYNIYIYIYFVFLLGVVYVDFSFFFFLINIQNCICCWNYGNKGREGGIAMSFVLRVITLRIVHIPDA